MPDTGAESAPDRDLARSLQSPTERRADWRCWLARVVLIGYVAFLFFLALVSHQHEPTVQLEDLLQFPDWIVGLLMPGLLAGARFLLLGSLVAFSAGRSRTPPRFFASCGRWLAVLLLGFGLFALLSLIELGRLRPVAAALLPWTGYVAGAWIGFTCLKGRRATLWLLPKLGLVLLALTAGTTGLLFLAVDEDPLSFQTPQFTSAEKRRLAEALQRSQPTADGFRQLGLSEREINLLTAMATAGAIGEGKARITLDRGTVRGDFSLKLPHSSPLPGWINGHATCRAAVTAGELEIHLEQGRVGRLSLPQFLLDAVSLWLTSAILEDPDLQHLVAAIDSVRVEPNGVETVFRSGELDDKVIPSLLARLGQKPAVFWRTQIYYRHLVQTAEELPQEDRFRAFLQAAFELAQRRSEVEDPVLENRAAILALAILLGHGRVESLVGPVTDGELRWAARRHVGRVTLRGRRDWCQHFWVSAALTLLSSESLSDEVGLFKEELDAGEGGSGFSFSDLLADRAGTLFAVSAIRDERSARRMHTRLVGGFELGEIFPPAADLPEGIAGPQLEAEYGGVGGEKYQEIMEEIERRLATCAGLR
jgi:hypothetical protein